MRKTFKYLSVFVLVIISLVVLVAVGLMVFVNPNDYKQMIAGQMQRYLHRPVAINGDLSWSFFPNIGIKMGGVNVENITIANVRVDVKLWPLLHKQLEILGVGIHDASIKGTAYQLNHVDIHARNIKLNNDFPLSIQGELQLNSNAKAIPFRLQSAVNVDIDKQILLINDLEGEFAAVALSGRVKVTHLLDNPEAQARLATKPFDLQRVLTDLGQEAGIIQSSKNAKATLELNGDKNNISVNGRVTIESLRTHDVQLTNVNLQPHFKDGVLNLNPVTADLYRGHMQSQATMDLRGVQPKFAMNAKLSNIQIGSLLQDLGAKKLSVQGQGNVDVQMTTVGADNVSLQKQLNGTGRFNVVNGTLVGIDLGGLIDSASALANKKPLPSSRSDRTNFDSITGTFNIRNGVIQNNDFVLSSDKFITKGDGRIDLPSHWINYVFYASIKRGANQRMDWSNLYGVTIPVAIRGKLDGPSVSVDAGQLLQELAKQNAKQELRNQIKERVSGPAGDVLQELLGQ